MSTQTRTFQHSFLRRFASSVLSIVFLLTSVMPIPSAQAIQPATVLNLPIPGTLVSPTATFQPPIIRGITFNENNPLQFDFLIDPGQEQLSESRLSTESTRLIKYFMASLTVPEDEMWVNLSPYERNRIVPDSFGMTEMGRDLLAQDYLLKQLTASLMYPEDELGDKFWKRVHKRAQAEFGTTDIPMNTFNKVWIVPSRASVYVNEQTVYVVESHLRVMLEEDYLALEHHTAETAGDTGELTTGITSEIVKEILIPEIEREINEGETFANLRQIYHSVILATWYKKNLKDSLLGQIYVDQTRTKGIDLADKQINQKIYEQYLKAFKKGVYNYIKEDYDPVTQESMPRKYFSGGAVLKISDGIDNAMSSEINEGQLATNLVTVTAGLRSDQVSYESIEADSAMVTIREGLGFVTGPLKPEYRRYLASLQDDFGRLSAGQFTSEEVERLANSIVKIRADSVDMRDELFDGVELPMLNVNERLTFILRMTREKAKYKARTNEQGQRIFSDRDIFLALYKKVVPLSWIDELMDSGLNKSQALYLVTGWNNPQDIWKNVFRPIVDELMADGLTWTESTQIVMQWKNPQNMWTEVLKPIRDQLMADGLNKSAATRLIIRWRDPNQVWHEQLKPVREELLGDGLTPVEATRAVVTWTNAKARHEATQKTMAALADVWSGSRNKLLRILVANKYANVVRHLNSRLSEPEEAILRYTQPLKEYEDKYGVDSAMFGVVVAEDRVAIDSADIPKRAQAIEEVLLMYEIDHDDELPIDQITEAQIHGVTYRQLSAKAVETLRQFLEQLVQDHAKTLSLQTLLDGDYFLHLAEFIDNAADSVRQRYGGEYSRSQIDFKAIIDGNVLELQILDNGTGLQEASAKDFVSLGGHRMALTSAQDLFWQIGVDVDLKDRTDQQGAMVSIKIPLNQKDQSRSTILSEDAAMLTGDEDDFRAKALQFRDYIFSDVFVNRSDLQPLRDFWDQTLEFFGDSTPDISSDARKIYFSQDYPGEYTVVSTQRRQTSDQTNLPELESALIWAQLDQANVPGVPKLLSIGITEDSRFWMRLLGITDGMRIDDVQGLSLLQRLDVFVQLTETLQQMHALGITHGDIYDGNVLVNPQNQMMLIDIEQGQRNSAAYDYEQDRRQFMELLQDELKDMILESPLADYGDPVELYDLLDQPRDQWKDVGLDQLHRTLADALTYLQKSRPQDLPGSEELGDQAMMALRKGHGFINGGRLHRDLAKYKISLQADFMRINAGRLKQEQVERLASSVVRIKSDSVADRPELFDGISMPLEDFASRREFFQRILVEKSKYEAVLKESGERFYTEFDIWETLYRRLIPLSWVDALMDEGLNKSYAILMMAWINPLETWRKRFSPVRDELMSEGLAENIATRIVLGWRDPKVMWEEHFRPVRDELISDGLGRGRAIFVVTSWRNPKRIWREQLKPARDTLVSEGLTISDATYIATTWKNPLKKWRTELKPTRDQLVSQEGLSVTHATSLAIKHKDAVLMWTTQLKDARDALVKEGLSNSIATSIVSKKRNPLKTWRQVLRPVRNQLVESGLIVSRANYLVAGWKSPRARMNAVRDVVANLDQRWPGTPSELRVMLFENSYNNVLQRLASELDEGLDVVEEYAQPLQAYEEEYGADTAMLSDDLDGISDEVVSEYLIAQFTQFLEDPSDGLGLSEDPLEMATERIQALSAEQRLQLYAIRDTDAFDELLRGPLGSVYADEFNHDLKVLLNYYHLARWLGFSNTFVDLANSEDIEYMPSLYSRRNSWISLARYVASVEDQDSMQQELLRLRQTLDMDEFRLILDRWGHTLNEIDLWLHIVRNADQLNAKWGDHFIKLSDSLFRVFNDAHEIGTENEQPDDAKEALKEISDVVVKTTQMDSELLQDFLDDPSRDGIELLYLIAVGKIPSINAAKFLYHGSTISNIDQMIFESDGYIDFSQGESKLDANYLSFNADVSEKYTGEDGLVLEFDVAKLLELPNTFHLGPEIESEEITTKRPVPFSALTERSKATIGKAFWSEDDELNQSLAMALGYASVSELQSVVTDAATLAEQHARPSRVEELVDRVITSMNSVKVEDKQGNEYTLVVEPAVNETNVIDIYLQQPDGQKSSRYVMKFVITPRGVDSGGLDLMRVSFEGGTYGSQQDLSDSRIGGQIIRALGQAVPVGTRFYGSVYNVPTLEYIANTLAINPAGDVIRRKNGDVYLSGKANEQDALEGIRQIWEDTALGKLFSKGQFTLDNIKINYGTRNLTGLAAFQDIVRGSGDGLAPTFEFILYRDAAMLAEQAAELMRAEPELSALQNVWAYTEVDTNLIKDWLDDDTSHDLPTSAALTKKLITRIMVFHSSGGKDTSIAWQKLLAQKWKLKEQQVATMFKWMLSNQVNLKKADAEAVHEFVETYVQSYRMYPNLRPAYVYYLPPKISDTDKLRLPAQNAKRMMNMFSPEFVRGDRILKMRIPDTDYFVAMQYGLAESTHGIYLALGRQQSSVDPMKGVFVRIGLDSQGDALRVNMMQGVQGRQDMINSGFPKDMHMHPILALLYVALEVAHQGQLKFTDGRMAQNKNPFIDMMGMRPQFISTMKAGKPTIEVMANYSRFGLRRKTNFARWQNVDHLVRKLVPGRATKGDMVSRSIGVLMNAFKDIKEIPSKFASPEEANDYAMIAPQNVWNLAQDMPIPADRLSVELEVVNDRADYVVYLDGDVELGRSTETNNVVIRLPERNSVLRISTLASLPNQNSKFIDLVKQLASDKFAVLPDYKTHGFLTDGRFYLEMAQVVGQDIGARGSEIDAEQAKSVVDLIQRLIEQKIDLIDFKPENIVYGYTLKNGIPGATKAYLVDPDFIVVTRFDQKALANRYFGYVSEHGWDQLDPDQVLWNQLQSLREGDRQLTPDTAVGSQNINADKAIFGDDNWSEVVFDQVNEGFDNWVNSGQMDQEDLKLLKEILLGDELRLAKLLKTQSDQVAVKAEDRDRPDQNGRVVYLTLKNPFPSPEGDMHILRIKGARPRSGDVPGELESHSGGGFVQDSVEVNAKGNPFIQAVDFRMDLTWDPEALTPQGALHKERADREYQMMQLGMTNHQLQTDFPIAVGVWKNKTHFDRPVGFVIAGMRQQDSRIDVKGAIDVNKMVADVITEDLLDTNLKMAKEIYEQIGQSMRAYHDAGYFHRFPHKGNWGVEFGQDSVVRAIMRDLDTTLSRAEIVGKDLRRMETAYRLLDIQRIVSDLSSESLATWDIPADEINQRVRPVIESLIKGYFYQMNTESAEYNQLVEDSVSMNFAGMIRELRTGDDKILLNAKNRDFGNIWQQFYNVSDSAMLANNQKENNPGGIDLNPKHFELEAGGHEIQLRMPFSPQQLEQLKVDGFTPVIIQISPVVNLPLLLGINTDEGESPADTVPREAVASLTKLWAPEPRNRQIPTKN